MTVSRMRFTKWLLAFGNYKFDTEPEQGRDAGGRWIKFIKKEVKQQDFEF